MSMKKVVLCLVLAALCSPLFSQTRQERLTRHVYFFAADSLQGRGAGTVSAHKAADYIAGEFESMGLKPFYEDWFLPFAAPGTDAYRDVVAVLEGNDPLLKDQYIVVGAHYDHLGIRDGKVYNGADDNASGTAAVIELARALCSVRNELKRTVVIAAFDAEEIGLYGSTALAKQMLEKDKLDVRLMMSVDMVGWYKASGNLTLEGVSTIKNGRNVVQSGKLNLKLVNFEKSILTATDTEGFAERGVPTLAVTTGLKSPYHKPEDDAELIDYEGLDRVTDYLTDLTFELASDPGFAPSGRVARKHRDGLPIFEVGLSLGAGSSHFVFPDAAFIGKNGFSYGAGLSAQLNFGHHSRFGLKAEGIYARTSAQFPDAADVFSSSLKYKGGELFVPVGLVYQGKGMERMYLGVGGYYNHRFSASLPVQQTVRKDSFGVSAEFGLKVGGIGMSVIWMIPVTTLFEESGAAPVRQATALFRFSKYL